MKILELVCKKKIKTLLISSLFLLKFDLGFCLENQFKSSNFIIDKKCKIYKFENNKFLSILNNNIDSFISTKKELKSFDIKKMNNSEYIGLKNTEVSDFYINKNCGYFKYENKGLESKTHKKIFNNEEIKIIEENSSEIDKEILSLCSDFGSHPKKEDFLEIIKKNKEKIRFIYNRLNKKVFEKEVDFDTFLTQISDILFNNNGFSHVFCGIIKNGKINGPHYAKRFLELEKLNIAGMTSETKNNKKILNIKNSINDQSIFINKTINYIDYENNIIQKYQNSFILNDNFLKILNNILNIAKIDFSSYNNKNINNNLIKIKTNSCILKDDEKKTLYKIVFNINNKSLITIFPVLENDVKFKNNKLCKFVN